MKQIRVMKNYLGIMAFVNLAACAAPTSDTLIFDVDVLINSAHCGYYQETGRVIWVESSDEFTIAWDKVYSRGLGAPKIEKPNMDFMRENVLVVFMGQRPTAGYGFTLPPNALSLAGDTASLKLNYLSPPKGAMTAQIITSPCIFLKITKTSIHKLRIIDQEGYQHHVLSLPR